MGQAGAGGGDQLAHLGGIALEAQCSRGGALLARAVAGLADGGSQNGVMAGGAVAGAVARVEGPQVQAVAVQALVGCPFPAVSASVVAL